MFLMSLYVSVFVHIWSMSEFQFNREGGGTGNACTTYRPVARFRITPVTLHGGVRKSRAGGPPLWRIVLTCDIRRHLGHLPGRVSAIEGVCRSVFGTVQHTVRHKRAEPSFVKKLAINTASVHFAIDKIRVVLQAWALISRILYVTLLMTSRAMGLYGQCAPRSCCSISKFVNRTISLHQRRLHLLPSRTWCASSRVAGGPEAKRRKNWAAFLNRIVSSSQIGLV